MIAARAHWVPAYVGLGSNLDSPAEQVQRAFEALREIADTHLVAMSDLYRNPPMGPQDQPDYVNAVAGLLTRKSAEELLGALQSLEERLGRVRTAGDRWGPRVIDLDLLVFGRHMKSVPGLNLPHPGISERNFVLLPLCNIAPLLEIPGQGMVADLAARTDASTLHRINASSRQGPTTTTI